MAGTLAIDTSQNNKNADMAGFLRSSHTFYIYKASIMQLCVYIYMIMYIKAQHHSVTHVHLRIWFHTCATIFTSVCKEFCLKCLDTRA